MEKDMERENELFIVMYHYFIWNMIKTKHLPYVLNNHSNGTHAIYSYRYVDELSKCIKLVFDSKGEVERYQVVYNDSHIV